MKMVTSDKYQCVAASFAMILGLTLEEMIADLGHNGLEIVAEDEDHPCNQRSYHPQELVDLLQERNMAMTMYELNPVMKHGGTLINHAAFLGQNRFFQAMLKGSGVIFGKTKDTGTGHAIAWDGTTSTLYDPRGYTWKWPDDRNFAPLQFFLIQPIR